MFDIVSRKSLAKTTPDSKRSPNKKTCPLKDFLERVDNDQITIDQNRRDNNTTLPILEPFFRLFGLREFMA